mmetsp:Transcript_29769/g.45381  ORF Transcript_29769/g.45381 Transcript_29769/m.45381 type:complete len:129 (-) Transcript_29769:1106-1492(-)
MQADDMGQSEFKHENVIYCVCMIHYEFVKVLRRKPLVKDFFMNEGDKYDYYSCPRAYVILTKHPFFHFFFDIISQIIELHKDFRTRNKIMMQDPVGDLDASFTTYAKNEVDPATQVPLIVPMATIFLN